jgi:DNA repair exonuclease SbcCD ATPase subunit
MSDIVERLRDTSLCVCEFARDVETVAEAADTITRLTAEVERLMDATDRDANSDAIEEVTALRAEIERLNSDLSDALTDLNTARQDNASCTAHIHNQAAEIEKLREALGKPLDTPEGHKLKHDAGLPHLPTQLTYECRLAVGRDGPRSYDWEDKPHRVVYDLCWEIETRAALTATTEKEAHDTPQTDRRYNVAERLFGDE